MPCVIGAALFACSHLILVKINCNSSACNADISSVCPLDNFAVSTGVRMPQICDICFRTKVPRPSPHASPQEHAKYDAACAATLKMVHPAANLVFALGIADMAKSDRAGVPVPPGVDSRSYRENAVNTFNFHGHLKYEKGDVTVQALEQLKGQPLRIYHSKYHSFADPLKVMHHSNDCTHAGRMFKANFRKPCLLPPPTTSFLMANMHHMFGPHIVPRLVPRHTVPQYTAPPLLPLDDAMAADISQIDETTDLSSASPYAAYAYDADKPRSSARSAADRAPSARPSQLRMSTLDPWNYHALLDDIDNDNDRADVLLLPEDTSSSNNNNNNNNNETVFSSEWDDTVYHHRRRVRAARGSKLPEQASYLDSGSSISDTDEDGYVMGAFAHDFAGLKVGGQKEPESEPAKDDAKDKEKKEDEGEDEEGNDAQGSFFAISSDISGEFPPPNDPPGWI